MAEPQATRATEGSPPAGAGAAGSSAPGTGSAAIRAHWASRFERLQEDGARAGRGLAWLGKRRQEAFARFDEAGFPTTRNEEWRYTSTAALAAIAWGSPAPGAPLDEAALGSSRLPHASAEIVLVDGRFEPALSRLGDIAGARTGSLAHALDAAAGRVEEWLERWLGRVAVAEASPFTALNLALFEDGAFLHVPGGVVLPAPVHVLHVATGATGATGAAAASGATTRTVVLLEPGAEARLVESFVGLGKGSSPRGFMSSVTEIVLAEGSSLEHDRLVLAGPAAYHVATIEVRQERSSRYAARGFCLGGALVRNDWNVVQAGEGIDCTLDGLYVARGEEHVDNHTSIDHALPHGTSRELWKGILDDRSHGVFNGKVIVRQGAQKTDSKQTNRNLLLSRDALIDTKPQLEIFADDVKCAHGATVGQLDENALFYLRSRGLGEAESRSLLTFAFASDVVRRIPDPTLRARVHDLLLERLPGGARLRGRGGERFGGIA